MRLHRRLGSACVTFSHGHHSAVALVLTDREMCCIGSFWRGVGDARLRPPFNTFYEHIPAAPGATRQHDRRQSCRAVTTTTRSSTSPSTMRTRMISDTVV